MTQAIRRPAIRWDSPQLRRSLLLAAIAAAYSVLYLHTLQKWWYEDDPGVFHYVRQIAHPLAVFWRPAILRGFGEGNALTPMQILSYRIDTLFVGASPFAAYLHNLAALAATSVLLYLVLCRWTLRWRTALAATVLWMLLPSTIVVHQYTATRHYMEGLLLALSAAYVMDRYSGRPGWGTARYYLCVGVLGAAAMLCKEIYAAAMPTFLLLSGLRFRRRRGLVALGVGLAATYAAYRVAMLGHSMAYGSLFPTVGQYLQFLGLLPFLFTANWLGYVYYLGIAILGCLCFVKDRRVFGWTTLCAGVLLAVTLLAVYPVVLPVIDTHRNPGTWYRIPFFANTVVLLLAAIWASRIRTSRICSNWVGAPAAALCLALMLPGTEYTRRVWDRAMGRAEAEGRFYLANPDKLVFSEEDAYWYLFGVSDLYRVEPRHFVIKQYLTSPPLREQFGDGVRDATRRFDTIWRNRDGIFVRDDELFRTIVRLDRSRRPAAPPRPPTQ